MVGGWRLSAIQAYNTGFPIGVTANGTLPIFNGTNRPLVTTYNWRAPISGSSFDPSKDKYLDASVFPVQPVGILGNAPRKNSQVRVFPTLNENVSLAKTFSVTERFRVDFRAEAFNVFNRVVFGVAADQSQQHHVRGDLEPGQFAAPDAGRTQAVLVRAS